jgi:hypothetical protein
LNDCVFIGVFVARRVRGGVEGHVGRDGVAGDEAGQGTDLSKKADLVDLKLKVQALVEL